MARTLLLTAILLTCLGASTDLAFAQDRISSRAQGAAPTSRQEDRARFLEDRERGWHWYEQYPEPEQEQPAPEVEGQGAGQSEEPAPMSVQWLRRELEESRIAAIDNPTRDNVEYYVYVQKIAMDRAEQFALRAQQVAMINPALDETAQNPTTTYARQASMRVAQSTQDEVLQRIAQDVGIFYFFLSTCQYCSQQNGTLTMFAERHDFRVMALSLDNQPMADGAFSNWRPAGDMARTLNVTRTPTLYLFKPPNEFVLLTESLQTVPQLERRILQISAAQGWITQEELERSQRGMAREFLVDAMLDVQDGVDWNDRAAVLAAFREASRVNRAGIDSTSGQAANTLLEDERARAMDAMGGEEGDGL